MKRAMERHEAGEARVIPIFLRPVDWDGAPFGKLQALPPNAKAVTEWRNRDKAFVKIAQAIRKNVEELTKRLETDSSLPKQVQDNSKRSWSGHMSNEGKEGGRSNTDTDVIVSQQEVIVFGIDLGTSYSCISYVNEYGQAVTIPNDNGDYLTPSVVLFEGNNRIVGKAAKNRAIFKPEQTVAWVKSYMGVSGWRYSYNGNDYTPEEISSYILRKLGDDAERHLGYPVNDVVITCPACFSIFQREAIVHAGMVAGFNVRDIINEPTAAAIAYSVDGLQNEQDQVVLLYDLGGGRFDITVIEIKKGAITVIASRGDHYLGGKNWDETIVSYLTEQWKAHTGSNNDPTESAETMQGLWNKAELAKWALTVEQETHVAVTHLGRHVGVTLTRAKFEELTKNLLERTIILTEDALKDAQSRGFPRINQILLVGGSTMMPQVVGRLHNMFDLPVRFFTTAVARGAAIYAQKLALDKEVQQKISKITTTPLDKVKIADVPQKLLYDVQQSIANEHGLRLDAVKNYIEMKIINVTSHSFGVVVRDLETNQDVISNIIMVNDPLPTKQTGMYHTLQANQEAIEIKVMENSEFLYRLDDFSKAKEIGRALLHLPPRLPLHSPIEVCFELQQNGRLHITAHEPKSGNIIETHIER